MFRREYFTPYKINIVNLKNDINKDIISQHPKEKFDLQYEINKYIIFASSNQLVNEIFQFLEKNVNSNIFTHLIEDEKIKINIEIIKPNQSKFFVNSYNIAKQIFIDILIASDESEVLDFYDDNIIHLPKKMIKPTRYNQKYKKYTEIQFRKDIFLQNYDFIQELKKTL